MARGYSTSRSEARSPEVLKVREAMKSDKGMNALEAIEKDPTLNAMFFAQDFDKELAKNIDKIIGNQADSPDPGGGTFSVEPTETYVQIGNKTYLFTTPGFEVDYTTADESFDYDYGSISSTQESYAFDEFEHEFALEGGEQDFLEKTTVQLVDPP